MKSFNPLRSDRGSMLLEAVGFSALAFGLLLTLSLHVFELERRQLGLEQIARNATRYYLLHPASDLSEAVDAFKALDSQFEDDELDIEVKCQPNDCRITGSLVLLEIKAGINMAKAFGVVP